MNTSLSSPGGDWRRREEAKENLDAIEREDDDEKWGVSEEKENGLDWI